MPRLVSDVGELMQRLRHVGRAARVCSRSSVTQQRSQMSRAARSAGSIVDDALVERRQADRVALPVHQVAERRRQARAVLELRHRRASRSPSTR